MWEIVYSDLAYDALKSINSATKERIRSAIDAKLVTNPHIFGKPLRHNLQQFRSLRVGDYRILYQIDNEAKKVRIAKIAHRSDVYFL